MMNSSLLTCLPRIPCIPVGLLVHEFGPRSLELWCDRLALFGLRLNVKKTEYLTTDVNELGSIKINGTELSRVTSFKYLGSTITSDGSLKLEVIACVSAA
ncbi:unnamed protein product [Heligmosomoides polygyrus]|uniref:Recep_L_domain domain-containing protein n=1 Tax=Heligmosomoides polygyrus TaxID=6339 RepID=A0A183G8B3_HELPZ|nr:unnamed protein product [Heligmosomoides polygyrus]